MQRERNFWQSGLKATEGKTKARRAGGTLSGGVKRCCEVGPSYRANRAAKPSTLSEAGHIERGLSPLVSHSGNSGYYNVSVRGTVILNNLYSFKRSVQPCDTV